MTPRESIPGHLLAVLLTVAGLVCPAHAQEYRLALPGYQYEFPRDHFNHPEFRTEWWYYTGNVRTPQGRWFGFELTFFRQALGRDPADNSPWKLDDVYLAHLALSDIERGEFHHEHRLNRPGPGLAGASLDERRIWNGNWRVVWEGDTQHLEAVSSRFTLRLDLTPAKPPVVHGAGGVSQKAEGAGHASLYISFTRLAAKGALQLDGETFDLAGQAWMDHEIFSHDLGELHQGWDWFSIQLDDGTDLMLYRLRRKDGSVEPYSSGTFVAADGSSRHLDAGEFTLTPGRTWKSAESGAEYPVAWSISVPSLGLELRAEPRLDRQELTGGGGPTPTYWEGAMRFAGSRNGAPVTGAGYLEMTGYDKPLGSRQENRR